MMNMLANRSRSLFAHLLIGCVLVGVCFPAGSATAELPVWYRLEIADARPPCMDAPAGSRCTGTQPRISLFEMHDGERIDMPSSQPLPPAWIELNRMWIYAPAVTDRSRERSIQLTATPMGARLLLVDGERQYLQSIELSRWTTMETAQGARLWVRVSPSHPGD